MEFDMIKTYTALGLLGIIISMFAFKLNKALFSLYPKLQPGIGYLFLSIIILFFILVALPYKFEGKIGIIIYVIIPSIVLLIMDMVLGQLAVMQLSTPFWESLNAQLKTILVSYFILWGITY